MCLWVVLQHHRHRSNHILVTFARFDLAQHKDHVARCGRRSRKLHVRLLEIEAVRYFYQLLRTRSLLHQEFANVIRYRYNSIGKSELHPQSEPVSVLIHIPLVIDVPARAKSCSYRFHGIRIEIQRVLNVKRPAAVDCLRGFVNHFQLAEREVPRAKDLNEPRYPHPVQQRPGFLPTAGSKSANREVEIFAIQMPRNGHHFAVGTLRPVEVRYGKQHAYAFRGVQFTLRFGWTAPFSRPKLPLLFRPASQVAPSRSPPGISRSFPDGSAVLAPAPRPPTPCVPVSRASGHRVCPPRIRQLARTARGRAPASLE